MLNIVVAHDLEARLPIQWLGLQQVNSDPRIYSDGKGIRLVVAGQGRQCAAAAVNYLGHSHRSKTSAAWLNFGIAGHQSLALGQSLVPDRIEEAASRETYYPAPVFPATNRGLLVTVDEPEFNYPEVAAYDMEGSAFWQAASKQSTLELVQCLKVVSDNREHSHELLNKGRILEIIESAREDFLGLAEAMLALLSQLPNPVPFLEQQIELRESVHLSSTQKIQLERLLQRLHALDLGKDLEEIVKNRHTDSRALISQLEAALNGKR